MKRVLKLLARGLFVLLLVAAVIGFFKRDEITRLLAVNSLFDEDKIVANFSAMDAAFLSTSMSRGDGPVRELPAGPALTLPEGTEDWIEGQNVTGLVVLHNGKSVHESTYLGTGIEDQRISWSMAKSWLSALFGIYVENGTIASLEDPVTKYAPELKGGAYDGASILNVLQMSSGIKFNEDYFDFNSDINRMGRVLALGKSMDEFAAELTETESEPGSQWHYVSIDTHVLGMVLRGATGRSVPDLLTEHIVEPLGLERDIYYLTDGEGVAFVLGGLNMTIRDFARFGQMIADGGAVDGKQVVPADWVDESTVASARTEPGKTGYGYQWWMPADARPGEFFARGIYGQYTYIDSKRDVVIVSTGANRGFRKDGAHEECIDIFRRIADSLSDNNA